LKARVSSRRNDSLLLTGIYIEGRGRVLLGFSHSLKKALNYEIAMVSAFGFGLRMGRSPKNKLQMWLEPGNPIGKAFQFDVAGCYWRGQTTWFMQGSVDV
jgi:hypothetical protein